MFSYYHVNKFLTWSLKHTGSSKCNDDLYQNRYKKYKYLQIVYQGRMSLRSINTGLGAKKSGFLKAMQIQ